MEINSKKCQTCGELFAPKRITRRHCYTCSVRVREKSALSKKVTQKTCGWCGIQFATNRKDKRFCSPDCNIRFHTNRPFAALREPTSCDVCGDTFVPTSKTNKSCSIQCSQLRSRRLAKYKEPNQPKPCVICGVKFTPHRVLDVCCSAECSHKRARKATDKTIICKDCGKPFTHKSSGVPVRCEDCRDHPRVQAEEPCAFCGKTFTRSTTEYPRFCSRVCSSNGINAEGLSGAKDKGFVLSKMLEFIKEAEHTPSMEEISEYAGVGDNYHTERLDLGVEDLFGMAGRKNKSLFPSKFEERVYHSLLKQGLSNEHITRQKKFPGLYYKHKGMLLRYDFFIEHLNLIVEVDGEQHGMREHPLYNCEQLKASDALKDAYAAEHGIRLVRIPYSPTMKGVLKLVSQQLAPLISNGQSKAL